MINRISIGKENNESRDDKTGSISNLEPPRDDEQLDANIEPAVQSTMCSSNINLDQFFTFDSFDYILQLLLLDLPTSFDVIGNTLQQCFFFVLQV